MKIFILTLFLFAGVSVFNCHGKVINFLVSPENFSPEASISASLPIGTVTLISPNGGENWVAGCPNNITWTTSGKITYIELKYSADSGNTWSFIYSPSPNSSPYSWNVPSGINSSQCKVKIIGYWHSQAVTDISDSVFSIKPSIGTVQLLSPNGSQTFVGGTAQNISWTISGNISSIDLKYTTDNENTWTDIASPSPTSSPYSWNIPPNINSSGCKVKILGYLCLSNVCDVSADTFSIIPCDGTHPDVNIISPGQISSINKNDNVTFLVSANDVDGLQCVNWYFDRKFRVKHNLTGLSNQDSWSFTFQNEGVYYINADVYDLCGRLTNVWWKLTVGEVLNDKHEFFDDFTYSDNAEPVSFGWQIVNGPSGPPGGATYDSSKITFENDQGNPENRILKLSTTATNNFNALRCSRIETSACLFYEGTYAARISFSNASIPFKDGNVHAFYAIKNCPGPNYAECDFEYLAYDVWDGCNATNKLYSTTWKTADPLVYALTKKEFSDENWHIFLFRFIDDENVEYYKGDSVISTQSKAANGDSVYPQVPMQIAFANWIAWENGHGDSLISRSNSFKVDWVYHIKDVALDASTVESRVSSLRSQGLPRYNTMPGAIISQIFQVPEITVDSGQSMCFNATQTINAGGSNNDFLIRNGGSVSLIAGQNILFLPSSTIQSGGYLHAYIATDGNYCGAQFPSLLINSSGMEEKDTPLSPEQKIIKVYPNPTSGKFIIEFSSQDTRNPVIMNLYGMMGNLLSSEEINVVTPFEFSLENFSRGIYFIRVLQGQKSGVSKIIKK